MLCKKKSIHHQNIVVAATRDLVRGVESRETTHHAREVLAPGILAPAPRRRLGGEIRLIDLERRARFARLSPEFV
jgi:hypothetical protein